MNKKAVDKLIPQAYEALKSHKIAENNSIPKTFRGQISSFGAAISIGSVLSAVAFFSQAGGGSEIDRSKLMDAVFDLMPNKPNYSSLREYIIKNNDKSTKENILNACIALKLAMNFYQLTGDKNNG